MTTTVEQDSWEILSGPGSVAYVDEIQCLIIRQTSPVQQEVLQFLRLWREAKQMERAASAGSTRNPVGRKTKPVKSSDAENDTDKVKGKK
jgi:hypothetical protein